MPPRPIGRTHRCRIGSGRERRSARRPTQATSDAAWCRGPSENSAAPSVAASSRSTSAAQIGIAEAGALEPSGRDDPREGEGQIHQPRDLGPIRFGRRACPSAAALRGSSGAHPFSSRYSQPRAFTQSRCTVRSVTPERLRGLLRRQAPEIPILDHLAQPPVQPASRSSASSTASSASPAPRPAPPSNGTSAAPTAGGRFRRA